MLITTSEGYKASYYLYRCTHELLWQVRGSAGLTKIVKLLFLMTSRTCYNAFKGNWDQIFRLFQPIDLNG